MTIELLIHCPLEQDRIQLLAQKIDYFASAYCGGGLSTLKSVIVVPDDQLQQMVNALHKVIQGESSDYRTGQYPPPAVALPFIRDSQLICMIVMTESTARHDMNGFDFTSTLLEELLHVEYYSATWQMYGRLAPPSHTQLQEKLVHDAAFLVDEYWVGRTKAPIMSLLFSVHKVDQTSEPFYLWYGGNLIADMNAVAVVVDHLRSHHAMRKTEHYWLDLSNVVKRYLLEPLTRNAAFFRANLASERRRDLAKPSESRFYRDHVDAHWTRINDQLESVFDNLAERENALPIIATTMLEIMNHVDQIV